MSVILTQLGAWSVHMQLAILDSRSQTTQCKGYPYWPYAFPQAASSAEK